MLIVDDIALFPIRSIFWVFRELHKAVQQELASEADSITAELTELYKMFESGTIAQDEFDAREKELLDRLEVIEERTTYIETDDENAEQQDSAACPRATAREAVGTEISHNAALKA